MQVIPQPFATDTEETEPALLVDVTGSMRDPVLPGGRLTKRDLATQVCTLVVKGLAGQDSQAADEQSEGGGGVYAVAFADDTFFDVGDLNPNSFEMKWRTLRWRGSTYILPGLERQMDHYNQEFGH